MDALDFVSLGLVAWIGFAAHRASLCNVRAVAEILDSRSPAMLIAFAKAIAWSAAVAGTLTLVLDLAPAAASIRTPFLFALVGGFVFGVGAALNRGCSLSTLQRLADGEMSMLVTLAGLVLGVASFSYLEAGGLSTMLDASMAPWMRMTLASSIVLLVLWLLGARELWHLQSRVGPASLQARVLAPNYRPATAAALIGVAGGLLYAVQGSWTYTNFLRAEVAAIFGRPAARPWQWWLAIALLFGMLASSVQRRSFSLRLPQRAEIARHAVAGWLMGCGIALVPGGNDTLLLASIPALSPRAVAVYLALLAGIALALKTLRALGRA